MVKAAWGAKRTCHGCGARFYDLNKNPIVCPKCGHQHDTDDFVKARRARSSALPAAEAAKKAPPPKKAPIDGVPDDEIPAVGDDEADDDALEDTDDLAENDDLDVAITDDKDETER